MRVGFIGTGKMGNMMASCLLDAGHELTVYDLRHEAAANLCERGAHWAEGSRLVAEASELVFTSLPGPAEMEASLLDPDNGVLAGLSSGSGYIDLTTTLLVLLPMRRRLAEPGASVCWMHRLAGVCPT